ncbi:MAG: trypsin-like peptidase domain-containing protein, partial [Thermoanaerobaculia bacterium]
MRTKTKVLSLTLLLTGGVVFGMILAGSLDFTKHASADKEPATVSTAASPRPQSTVLIPSFADIAEQVTPAIVSVTATDIVKADKRKVPFHGMGGEGEGGSPFDFFFPPDRRGRGGSSDDDEDRKELSGGTGFIIEPDGYILTNNHVIDGAEKVMVKVGDNAEYKATVVGHDAATDLALLKIDGKEAFPFVRLGDSEHLRVGDWVMAIG